jgi:cbb3-type cytochrome oxidase subunit 3
MFTGGRIIFALVFLVVFIIGMLYAYRKDIKTSRLHFSKSYLIIIGILLIFSSLFLIIKVKSWYFK